MTSSLRSSIQSSDDNDSPKRASIESSKENKSNVQKFREQNLVRQYSIMENDKRASDSIKPSKTAAVNNLKSTNHDTQYGKRCQ